MIHGMHPDVLMVAGYAVVLVGVAAVLELMARQSHRLSEQFHVAGFTFHPQLDAWKCPAGQHLARKESDYGRRVILYQAPAHACNACHCKPDCTDSDDGRKIERRLDSWLRSEVRRFHRGLSLVLLLLAALILAAEMGSRDTSRDWFVLSVLLLLIVTSSMRLLATFLAHEN
jgi:DDE family transposase